MGTDSVRVTFQVIESYNDTVQAIHDEPTFESRMPTDAKATVKSHAYQPNKKLEP